ncbi:hypothetical protein AX16_006773 [Volvariella volvacea WC 439]|nr:hypothetical protein AX16_006773 [Volvariella volvacea WC 439]
MPSTDLYYRDWLDDIDDIIPALGAKPGNDLPTEIKCYSIPYGALGFVSHLLTYWALGWLWAQRRPFMPWKKLTPSSAWNVLIDAAMLLGSGSLAIYTLSRCHNTWQLLLIGIWKLFTSIAHGAAALDAARKVNKEMPSYLRAPWFITFYCLGMIPGMVGLMSLIKRSWFDYRSLRVLTMCFYAFVGLGMVLGLLASIYFCFSPGYGKGDVLGAPFVGFWVTLWCFILGSALYSDWALGIMSENLVGFPSGDMPSLYYGYLAIERFSMFSI